MSEQPHNASTYSNHGCRCTICRKGHAAEVARMRANRKAKAIRVARSVEDAVLPHGNYSTYSNWGCRCDECRAASAAYSRAYYARTRRAS